MFYLLIHFCATYHYLSYLRIMLFCFVSFCAPKNCRSSTVCLTNVDSKAQEGLREVFVALLLACSFVCVRNVAYTCISSCNFVQLLYRVRGVSTHFFGYYLALSHIPLHILVFISCVHVFFKVFCCFAIVLSVMNSYLAARVLIV